MPDSEIARNMFLFSNAAAAAATGADIRPEVCLIERLLEGEREAFDELYRMYSPVVHGIVLLRVPYSEVPDIVQEVFLLAFENLPKLRERNAFAGWLARIARNRAAEFHRTKRPSEELPEELTGPKNATPEALEILETIRSLPQAYRETLVLRLVEGMTGAEIAERTGMTHESVRVNLHRGMEMLRQKLGIRGKKK
jgi:RNA polymerase sigma-70 factor, ECF subfamily